MEILNEIFINIHGLFTLLAGIASFLAWKRAGFKAPRYLHIIAIILGVIAVLIVFMVYDSKPENAARTVWVIILFPAITYFVFAFFGGGHVMEERNAHENEKL